MDERTVKHYTENADYYFAHYNSFDRAYLQKLLKKWLPDEGEVLEIGCGAGNESNYISTEGLEVIGTDASDRMLQTARRKYPAVEFRHAAFPLSEDDTLLDNRFDSIVALAMIMHIPEHELFDTAYQIRSMLKPEGIFICSFSLDREVSDRDPRLFIQREPSKIQLLFERLGLKLISKEENSDTGGRSIKWVTLVFKYETYMGVRSIDQIESIVNREKKTSTYKLALLRALCEISQQSFHHARWHENEMVSVPLGLIVEKWIYYYWALFDSDLELPEMKVGKRAGGLAFRDLLQVLINEFDKGGLNAFFAAFQRGILSDEQTRLLAKLVKKMAHTIIKGPVTYSGGLLEGIDKVFMAEGKVQLSKCRLPGDMINGCGRILFPSSIWRELCLLGHWIGESIILRWAELSRKFTDMSVSLPDIIAQLLVIPEMERATNEAKIIYSEQESLNCVWSDQRLSACTLNIDHVIPFSLWHNNDLWNLMPTHKTVNMQKRDKIVSREKLISSRDSIIEYWKILFENADVRFESEAKRTLLGGTFRKDKWELDMFSALSEAAESVAIQRGVIRW